MKSSVKLKSSLKNATADLYNMATTFTEKKLRMAASTNNTENLRKFLANGVNVNGSDGQKRTSLHFAASKGYSGEFWPKNNKKIKKFFESSIFFSIFFFFRNCQYFASVWS